MSVSAGKDIAFSNPDNVGRYSHSDWAERGFCKTCGSNLFFRMKASDHYFIMAGALDESQTLWLEEQQFIDDKPSYYAFSNETKNITKAEMYKMLHDFLDNLHDQT